MKRRFPFLPAPTPSLPPPSSSHSNFLSSTTTFSASASDYPPRPRCNQKSRKTAGEGLSAPFSGITSPRGVTRHKWTGRYEVHIWDKDKDSVSAPQNKGRQVFLGAYENEETAARTYDLAALKYWGPSTILNFPASRYVKEYEEMQTINKEKYVTSLRRRTIGFNRGVSKYLGVTRQHDGRWEARISRVLGKEYHSLGTYGTEEEAAIAYDKAAMEYEGPNAITNFDKNRYLQQQSASLLPQSSPPPAPAQIFAPPLLYHAVPHLSAPPQPTQTEPTPPLEIVPQSSMQPPSLVQNEFSEEAPTMELGTQNGGMEVHGLMDPTSCSSFVEELIWNPYLNPSQEQQILPDDIFDDDFSLFFGGN